METISNDRSQTTPARTDNLDHWAPRSPFLTLTPRELPSDALNLNVEGRLLSGPMQGFGQFWWKTYRICMRHTDAQPAELISTWKDNFPRFWPQGNRFFAPLTGIKPGEVGLINAPMPGGTRLSTGVMVLYADDESFTLMTPQGHVFSGWITFCSWREPEGLIVEINIQMRGSDPAFEAGLLLYGHQVEDQFWTQTLKNLAAHFDNYPEVVLSHDLVDPGRQWRFATNIVHNAFIHSVLFDVSRPLRWILQRFRVARAPLAG